MSKPENQAMMEQTSSAPGPKRKSRTGPRPKHVPIRTCAICREQGTKRGLTRIVRQPDGSVAIDPSGRLNGRGAYICDKASCRDRAASTDVLAKALNVDLSQEFRDALRQFGRSAADDAAEPGPTGK
jgi:predicted RNA-binding protein YlxR (DUF448 family)